MTIPNNYGEDEQYDRIYRSGTPIVREVKNVKYVPSEPVVYDKVYTSKVLFVGQRRGDTPTMPVVKSKPMPKSSTSISKKPITKTPTIKTETLYAKATYVF